MSMDSLLTNLPADPKAAPLSSSNGAGPMNAPGWQDSIIKGATPDQRNVELQRLVSRWVEKHMSAVEVQLMADALADKWGMDAAERDKLDKLISRALERGAQFSEEDAADYLDAPIDPLADLLERAETPPDRSNVLSTGIAALDNACLGGMYPAQLWYNAAMAWVGKSVVWTQTSYNAALQGADVLYISTEASRLEIHVRVMAQIMTYPASRLLRIVSGQLHADELDKKVLRDWQADPVKKALLEPLRLRYEVRDDLDTIDAIDRRLAERARRGRPARVLVVDQMNDLSTPGQEGRFAIEAISKGLKTLTRRYGVTTLACSQVNRGNDTQKIITTEEAGKIWTPDVFNLRETEVLRHHGHVLMFLGRNYTHGDPRRMAFRITKVRGAAIVPPVFELPYEPKYLTLSMPNPVPAAFPYTIEDSR
jgi:KaiC/GvpD/RAD55 family RecA-like ATPase